jgi:hypothetical protein
MIKESLFSKKIAVLFALVLFFGTTNFGIVKNASTQSTYQADIDHDGDVGSADFAISKSEFPTNNSPPYGVPAPSNIIGSCKTPSGARGVYISGRYAYLADGLSGLQVINISNPSNPSIVSSCDTPGYAWAVHVKGSYAFVSDRNSGLQVIDISKPSNPSIVDSCDKADYECSVRLQGSYAYVADRDSGPKIIDMSNPSNPFINGSCSAPDYEWGIHVQGSYAYVADYYSGLQVISLESDEVIPYRTAEVTTDQSSNLNLLKKVQR